MNPFPQCRRFALGGLAADGVVIWIMGLVREPPYPNGDPETSMKRFADLCEQEVLGLATSSEEEDNRIYSRAS